jgi:protein involved in polysaccharide export with SLBB domain
MMRQIIFFTTFLSSVFAQVDLTKLSNAELDILKKELGASDTSDLLVKDTEQIDNQLLVSVDAISKDTVSDLYYFGYDYFEKDISFADNTPAPKDYILGPGDEIILSLWGETNSRQKFVIDKEGLIYYNKVGPINISGRTIVEAESFLVDRLSEVYSTLTDKNNPTELKIELGSLKSINIYFSGEFSKPGISPVYPFADLLTAIIQAGGVTKESSLRNIEIIRDGELIHTVDFYKFFNKGDASFFDIKLMDRDIIYIPRVNIRANIQGQISRPGYYELFKNETLDDLISHAGRLTSNASSNIIIDAIEPIDQRLSDDYAMSSKNVKINEAKTVLINDGDFINIKRIENVESKVKIFGRVKSPGEYAASSSTLKDILDIAGGFDDPEFRKTIHEDIITILRKDNNQFYHEEISVAYKDADQFKLEVNDKILVYEDVKYRNSFTYRVEGEVFRPGTYAINKEKITVREALSLAGGLTDLSSERNLTIKQEFTTVDDEGNKITNSEPVNNVNLDFEIGINSVIIASPLENVVKIEGNVYNPGLITYSERYRYPKYIELAGGYKPNTLKRRVYIKRANGNVEKVKGFFISRGKNVYPGDTIFVPENMDPQDFDITAFISDFSTTLANIAAILLIVDNSN